MKKISLKTAVIIMSIIYAVGLAGHMIPMLRPYFIHLAPIALCIAAAVMLYNDILVHHNKKLFIWCIMTFIFTYIVEVIGVSTGMIFGKYSYGSVLGPKAAGVPPVIALNWVAVILGSAALAKSLSSSRMLVPLLAAALCAGFDFILEPVAVQMGYWQWQGVIPAQNYAAWGIIALICVTWLQFLGCVCERKIIAALCIMQVIYIGILRLFFMF